MVMVTRGPSTAHRDQSILIPTDSRSDRTVWLLKWVTIEEDHILNEGEIFFVLKSFLAAVYITPNGKDIKHFKTWKEVAYYSSCRNFRDRAAITLEKPFMYAFDRSGDYSERFFFLYDDKLIYVNNSGDGHYGNSFACDSVFEMDLASFGNILEGLNEEWNKLKEDWHERYSVSLSPFGVCARLDDYFNIERTYAPPPISYHYRGAMR